MNNQEILEANKVFTSKSVLINESFSNNTVLWTDKHYRSIADIEEIEKLRAQLKMAKADGVREVAKQMNTIYASEHNQKKVPPGQFGRLYERLRRLNE